MIPVKLKLRNFLSYSDIPQELDFSNIKVAIITGANGSGKSALIEAIIFALFGKGRFGKESKAFIRYGEKDMEIELLFELEQKLYKIVRGQSLEKDERFLHIYKLENGSSKMIPIRTKKGKDEYLQELIGMDYETFLNASFITQGNSATFSRDKKPAERHALLASILQLERFEQMEKIAREKHRELTLIANEITSQIEHLNLELQNLQTVSARKSELGEKLSSLKKKSEKLKAEELKHNSRLNKLILEQHGLEKKKEDLEELEKTIERLKNEKQEEIKKLAEIENILKQEPEIKEKERQFNAISNSLKEYKTKAEKYNALKISVQELEGKLSVEETKLKTEIKNLTARIDEIENEINSALERLKDEDEIRRQYNIYKAKRAAFEELKKKREQYLKLRDEQNDIKSKLEQERVKLETELKNLISQKTTITETLSQNESLIAQKQTIEQEINQLEALETKIDALKEELNTANAKLQFLQKEISLLKAQEKEISEKIYILKNDKDNRCPVCRSPLSETNKKDIIENYETQIEKIKEDIKKNVDEHEKLSQRIGKIQDEIQINKGKIEKLKALRDKKVEICEKLKHLDEEKQKLETLTGEIQKKKEVLSNRLYAPHLYEKLNEITNKINSLTYDEELYINLEKEIESLRPFESEMENLATLKRRINELNDNREKLAVEYTKKMEQYKNGSYAVEIREEILKKRQELTALNYDEITHRKLEQEYENLKDVIVLVEKLSSVKNEKEERIRKIDQLTQELYESEKKRENYLSRIKDIPKIAKKIELLKNYLKKLTEEKEKLENEIETLSQEYGRIIREYETLEEKSEKLKKLTTEANEIRNEARLYGIFERVVGRDGVQSFIVKSVVPIVENEANRLLDLLTDGRIKVKLDYIETPAKKELHLTTLYDGVPRKYEGLSGGEAFRVDFALRIGLSRLLAMRSGKQLKTLVIDEGFGTQDAEGLSALEQCIKMIEPEFEKIIVISHLDQLKTWFPTVIEVVKDPVSGSKIFVH